MPYHVLLDTYEEDRLAGKAYGSTKSGIAPFYADKVSKDVYKRQLLVRVAGYSAYFVELRPDAQQAIIDRTELANW